MIILDYMVGEKNSVDYVVLDGETVRYKTGRAENVINKMSGTLEITPQEFIEEIKDGWSNGYITFVPVDISQEKEQTISASSLRDWVDQQRTAHGS